MLRHGNFPKRPASRVPGSGEPNMGGGQIFIGSCHRCFEWSANEKRAKDSVGVLLGLNFQQWGDSVRTGGRMDGPTGG